MINIDDIKIRDPFIYKEENIYYLYGTTHIENIPKGFYGYKSKDLINFEGPYPLFIPNDIDKYGDRIFWAPEVYKYNNKYYLFGTIYTSDEIRQVHIFVSDSAMGNYVPLKDESITPKEWHCLDGNLFIDEDNTPYLIFCREWVQLRNGRMYIVQLSQDLKSRVGEPVYLFSAQDAKWCSPICGDGYVTDGPFVYKKKGLYYMLWSSYSNDKYSLSVIKSTSLFGPWEQEEIPFLNNDGGHGMLFEDNNKIYLATHCPNSLKERLKITLFDDDSSDYLLVNSKK